MVALEDGLDRGLLALQRGGEARDLGGDIVDALAQHRVLHALVGPRALGVALHLRDLALELGALLLGLAQLVLDQRLLGADRLGRELVAAFDLRELGADVGFGLLGGGGVVAQAVGDGLAIGQEAALLVEPRGHLLHAAAEQLVLGGVGDDLAIELAHPAAELLRFGALLVELPDHHVDLGALVGEALAQVLRLFLEIGDLALLDLVLGARGDQLHALAVGRDRALVEGAADLGELGLGLGESVLHVGERAHLAREFLLHGGEFLGQLPVAGLEREHRHVLFAELHLEAADGVALLADLGELARGLRLHLLHAQLEAARGHREFGAQLVLVGLDLGHGHGGERLEAAHGQAHGARMHQRNHADDEQARDQEPDPDIHDRFDHKKAPPEITARGCLPECHGAHRASSPSGG